ncbi:alpha-2A adrenergic receptor-like [Stylophora pistillata]|uniref:alpha-2A adrenergic receptor-like n=1 Tax=Stylophora pistillata TaxID=50429 RepID=UPI000C04C0B9|nr:alpha-2A adrenergic receptor-like [Stylophora pistillata]
MHANSASNHSSFSNIFQPANDSGKNSTAQIFSIPSDFEIIAQVVILIVVLVVSVGGNGLVCYLVFTVKQLQVPTNYFILSLALADFLFALVCLPFRIVNVLEYYLWTLGLAACRFWVWLDLLFCSASIANLAAISVDRYLKIASPLTYDIRMTSTRVAVILIILWGYSMSLASLSFVSGDSSGILVRNQICYIDNKIYLTAISVIGFFAPFTIMILMYCFVFKVAVNQATEVFRLQESLCNGSERNSRRKSSRFSAGTIFFEVKATKTLIILLSVFCICWSPFFVLTLLSLYSPEAFKGLPVEFINFLKITFVHLFPNCNAAFNPIIYTTYNHQFRKAIQRLLKRYKADRSGSFNSFSEPASEIKRRIGSAVWTKAPHTATVWFSTGEESILQNLTES